MGNTHIEDPRENTFTKNIYNHQCEVYFAPALLKYYPADKDREAILKLIDEQFYRFNALTYHLSHVDYKSTEIVWRSEYIEEMNILWIGANINQEYQVDDHGNRYLELPLELQRQLEDYDNKYQQALENGEDMEVWEDSYINDFYENHPLNSNNQPKDDKKIIH